MKIFVLLDRSGSMQSNWKETLGAINTYVETQTKVGDLRGSEVTLSVFDSGEPMLVTLRSAVKNTEWVPVTENEVKPRAYTPLFDAIKEFSKQVDVSKADKATIVIITDGAENTSKHTTKSEAGNIISKFKDKGYDVVFIGADFDAFGQSASVGVGAGSTLTMAKGAYNNAMGSMITRNVFYSSGTSAKDLAFTVSDRTAAVTA